MNCGEGIAQGVVKATQTGILWSQVQVLVGPPEKQALISNGGGLLFDYDHSGGAEPGEVEAVAKWNNLTTGCIRILGKFHKDSSCHQAPQLLLNMS